MKPERPFDEQVQRALAKLSYPLRLAIVKEIADLTPARLATFERRGFVEITGIAKTVDYPGDANWTVLGHAVRNAVRAANVDD